LLTVLVSVHCALAAEPVVTIEGLEAKIAAFTASRGGAKVACPGASFRLKPTVEAQDQATVTLKPSTRKAWVYMPTKLAARNITKTRVVTADGKELVAGSDYYLNPTGALALLKGDKPVRAKVEFSFLPERYDSVFLDPKTGVLRLVEGQSRRLDAEEYVPATPAGTWRICNLVVRGEGVESFFTPEPRDCVQGREFLKPFLSKLKKGQPVRLCGYGDSITAVQAGRVGLGPNSVFHDRVERYFGRYRTVGTQDKIETFDFGDGAGKKHCKMGWNWRLVEALDRTYGVKTTYLNCGIGSTTSSSTMLRPGIANGLYPERLEAALATRPDLVVLAFGMNERGSNQTGPNTAKLIQRFQAVGAAVIVMGVPKVNGCMWRDGRCPPWEKTNGILAKTAAENAAAFVDPRLIDLGTAPRHWCSSNNYNHPGLRELLIYGHGLASAVE
jgi:hypothetical protein